MAGRNCIILGAGRSGTSMVAGSVAASGYFMGEDLHPPRAANPKGFFEGRTVKELNEDLLAPLVRDPWPGPLALFTHSRVPFGSRWLARVPVGSVFTPDATLALRVQAAVAQTPFAYKDPRFCYTLSAWRPFLPPDIAYICVFRHPARTAHSLVKECREAPWLRGMRLTFRCALELWELMYRHVLEHLAAEGDWLFVHYDQFLDGSAYDRVDRHLRTEVDRSFADSALSRSPATGRVGARQLQTYATLCKLAEFQ